MTSPNPDYSDSASLGRRERKKLETRGRILESGTDLFADKGFDATTVEEIAEGADVSRATFFKHFSEKAALVAELGDAMLDTFLGSVEKVRREDASTVDRLQELFERSTERLEARSALARALVFETVARRRDLAERRGRTVRLHEGIAALLQDGVQRGEVRQDVPLALLAKMVAGAYLEILLTWVVDPSYKLGENLRLAVKVLDSTLSVPAPESTR